VKEALVLKAKNESPTNNPGEIVLQNTEIFSAVKYDN
jgi:hypothetical protein